MKGKERVERVAGFEKSDELFYNESINILQPATLSTLSTLLLFYILHTVFVMQFALYWTILLILFFCCFKFCYKEDGFSAYVLCFYSKVVSMIRCWWTPLVWCWWMIRRWVFFEVRSWVWCCGSSCKVFLRFFCMSNTDRRSVLDVSIRIVLGNLFVDVEQCLHYTKSDAMCWLA